MPAMGVSVPLPKTKLLCLQVKQPSEGAAAPPAMSFNDMLDNYAPSTYTHIGLRNKIYTYKQVCFLYDHVTCIQSF